MCGIIAVVRRPSARTPPTADELLGPLDHAVRVLEQPGEDLAAALGSAADAVEEVDRLLRGGPGVRSLLASPDLIAAVDGRAKVVDSSIVHMEGAADAGDLAPAGPALEAVNAALVRLKDATWALRRDRLRTAEAVRRLARWGEGERSPAAIDAYTSIQIALSALDRLEVRGRDSAGIHLLVEGHGLDLEAPDVRALLDERSDPLFMSMAACTANGHLSLAYKAAAEIGELGDNSRALRAAITGDALLRRALASDRALVMVLGHTRWASVGTVSEANAHPLNSEETDGPAGHYVAAALNGDVDNHADLRTKGRLRLPVEVTTDAKVIPTLVSRRLAAGGPVVDAFRETVATFDGSVAIGASAADDPGRLFLGLRGSGQGLYVGLAEDAFVVASEPYGLVEETPTYVRMDGEAPGGRAGTPGQVVVLDRGGAGELAGMQRLAYDGTELPVGADEVHRAEITTRDIDRGPYPHFLLKEVSEAPMSIRKTLRGRIAEHDGRLAIITDDSAIPPMVVDRLRSGAIRRVLCIGAGTAAVAAQAVAAAVGDALAGSGIAVEATLATELSGFGLRDEMDDTLLVPISQSGTTTDVNRTVDLVRARGAAVVAVVNRRNSDLVEKSHGVLYTSDGRDVEMSVPSTKAFYGQVAAGFLLGAMLGEAAGTADPDATSALLEGLRRLPEAMQHVLDTRAAISEVANRLAPSRRYWAVVGNGANRIAAAEIRIKLSELCYRSIACDVTEDKKHVDLSAEPLIFVCAAGLSGANADDVAKEVAIYRAHKAAPVVVATQGEGRFSAALGVLPVPEAHPALAFLLSAMAGHLFGYEAALAIDAQARPLREARAAVEAVISSGETDRLLERLDAELAPAAAAFTDGMRSGAYNGNLEASTAVRLSSLLRYTSGILPLEAYELDNGRVGTPSAVVADLTNALTKGIEELTRPVDAIKHQAKTVTVGISRSEDALLEAPLVRSVLAAGAGRDRLSYRALRTLAALGPAVAEVTGYTRYRIEGDVSDGGASISVLDRGGVAATISSRVEGDSRLRGTKRRAASQRQVTVARGRHDGRMVLLVPETKDGQATGITLLHVRFSDELASAVARAVLEGYQGRYGALRDAVTETEPRFRDEVLAEVPIAELLTVPVHVLADRWR